MSSSSLSLLDLKALHAPIDTELREAVQGVLTSGQYILGEQVTRFESLMCEYLGVAHGVGVSSGSDALLVALMTLGLGPGDEVITSPFSFFASAGCIHRVGARPVFVDIDPATFNLNVDQVEAALTDRTRAVVAVHLFGQCCDLDSLMTLCARYDLKLVEDAAQSLGARHARGPAGAVGDFGCFSFFPTKNLGGFGDGGMVVTSSSSLAERLRRLRVHGSKPKYHHELVGGNFRLDPIQAAGLSVKLRLLDEWIDARSRSADLYDARLADFPGVAIPRRRHGSHSFNQYVVRVPDRDAVKSRLAERGIPTMVYYPEPLHLQPCFAYLGYERGDMPEAERACGEVLALPMHPTLTDAQVEMVCTGLRAALA